jgi:hypothetical protein
VLRRSYPERSAVACRRCMRGNVHCPAIRRPDRQVREILWRIAGRRSHLGTASLNHGRNRARRRGIGTRYHGGPRLTAMPDIPAFLDRRDKPPPLAVADGALCAYDAFLHAKIALAKDAGLSIGWSSINPLAQAPCPRRRPVGDRGRPPRHLRQLRPGQDQHAAGADGPVQGRQHLAHADRPPAWCAAGILP